MSRIVVQTFLTLDGVMQGISGRDEDPAGGFEHGGWLTPYGSEESADVLREWHSGITGLLFGRRTYEIFAGSWGQRDPGKMEGHDAKMAEDFHRVPKYVASRTLTELEWQNSRLLGADVPAAVARIREEGDGEIQVWGSGELIQTLMKHGLVDEFRLMIHPVVLGSGKRLFPEGAATIRLDLVSTRGLANGAVLNTYRRGGEVTYADLEPSYA
jgi:dihydrofolate reductase